MRNELLKKHFYLYVVLAIALLGTACQPGDQQTQSVTIPIAPSAYAVEPSPATPSSSLAEIKVGGGTQRIPLNDGGFLLANVLYALPDDNGQPQSSRGFVVPDGKGGYIGDQNACFVFIPTTTTLETASGIVLVIGVVLYPEGQVPPLPQGWTLTSSKDYPDYEVVAVTENHESFSTMVDLTR